MADNRATVTLEGDSKGLVDAAQDGASSIESLQLATAELNKQAELTPDVTAKATEALRGLSQQSSKAARQATNSASVIGSLGRSISSISPQAGAALSSIGSLSGGFGNLAGAINPATLGIAALGFAVTTGVSIWKDYQEEIRRTQEELYTLKTNLDASDEALRKMGQAAKASSGDVSSFADSIAATTPQVREALAEYDKLQAALRGQEAFDAAERELAGLRKGFAAWGEIVADLSSKRARGIELTREETVQLTAAQNMIAKSTARYNELTSAVERVGVARRAAADAPNIDTAPIQKAKRDYDAMADAAIKSAVETGNIARAVEMLSGGGRGAGALAKSFRDVSDEVLGIIGLTENEIDSIRRLNDEMRSGADILKDTQAAIDARNKEIELARQTADAFKDAQEKEAAAMRERLAAQNEWFSVVTLGYDDMQAHQDAVLQSGLDAARSMRELTDAERSAVTEYYQTLRDETQKMHDEIKSLQESMTSGFESIGTGAAVDAISTLSSAFTKAAIDGENMAEALGVAALKSIGQIAQQFGTLMLTTAIGMAFLPGFQGNAAGLITGGALLTALGASLGVAANAIGGGSSPQAPSVDTPQQNAPSVNVVGGEALVIAGSTTIDPAYNSRVRATEEEQGSRYGIDKQRAYA